MFLHALATISTFRKGMFMRIALVNPLARRMQGYNTIGSNIPPLGLQILTQLTQPEHTVEIIDEIFGLDQTEDLLRQGRYDLVGITSYTSTVTRAYELAAVCRRIGVRCVMGGPHASAMPQEAGEHFDSVAVGECDEIWAEILSDAVAGRLKPRYDGRLSDLSKGYGRGHQTIGAINGKYDISCIQTSRGCPCGCDFCSVTRFSGPTIRRRPIDQIVDEWNSTPKKFLFVVDDNFFGVGPKDVEWARQCLREIIKRGKKRMWFSQTTMNVGSDLESLRLAHKAGCRGMFIGFETFNAEGLKSYHKGINGKLLDRYRELVAGFHKAGISVFGSFVAGGEEDTTSTVADTALQAVGIGIDIIQITNLTPLPGTRIYERWLEEGRIFATQYPADWERYTFTETVFKPSKMTSRQLDETMYELRLAASQEAWVWRRTIRSLWRTKSLTSALFVHGMNKGWQRLAKAQAPRDAKRFDFNGGDGERMAKLRLAFALGST